MVRPAPILVAYLLAAALCPAAQAASALVTAVHATKHDPPAASYDAHCQRYKRFLEDMPYNRFEAIARRTLSLDNGASLDFTINERYSLTFDDVIVESDGRVRSRVKVIVVPKSGGEAITLLEMRVTLAPRKPVLIRGLPMDEGEIAIVLELQ